MFHAEVEATSRCNTRCLHCPHEAISRPGGKMTWETFTRIVDQIRRHTRGDRYSLSFSGMGEPLLNPLLYDFIRHVSGEARTSFASNGSALTPDNVRRLADAGLDAIYVSFNGDEPEIFERMMGGLDFDRVLTNVRSAVTIAKDRRLKIGANVSVARANQDRVTRIRRLLESEGVGPISYSLCHSRGGNLKDPAVCDTPPMEVDRWRCDVMEHTLFVDWRGRAHICDHDLHDEYPLGDLLTEDLPTVLARRQKILDDGCALEICRDCTDVMKIGGTPPLASGAGGIFRDWIYGLYEDLEDPLSEASEPLKWIFRIYAKEGRTDRFANRLLRIEREARVEISGLHEQIGRLDRDRTALAAERDALRAERDALRQAVASQERTLLRRDAELAALHASYQKLRRSWPNRVVRALEKDVARIRGWFLPHRNA